MLERLNSEGSWSTGTNLLCGRDAERREREEIVIRIEKEDWRAGNTERKHEGRRTELKEGSRKSQEPTEEEREKGRKKEGKERKEEDGTWSMVRMWAGSAVPGGRSFMGYRMWLNIWRERSS